LKVVASQRHGRAGVITLDRPEALNALTMPMVRAIHAALEGHVADAGVEVIVIRSSTPKAFCAGGDMRRIGEQTLAGRFAEADASFQEEYALNLAIARCPKPYVALLDGIAMGGGLGLSVHGRHRVVTEYAVLAMPETALGFIPDVGASYFLNKLPPGVGMWLGLTGARLRAAGAIASKLATQMTRRDRLPSLLAALQDAPAGSIEEVLRTHADPLDTTAAAEALQRRSRGFDAETLPAVYQAWRAQATEQSIAEHSPASVAWTFELLRSARGLSLAEALGLELAAAKRAIRHPDFHEGVRAVLVDKDRRPRWHEVSEEVIPA
jgi:enoyl-CoA hydratase/carnithine racemase